MKIKKHMVAGEVYVINKIIWTNADIQVSFPKEPNSSCLMNVKHDVLSQRKITIINSNRYVGYIVWATMSIAAFHNYQLVAQHSAESLIFLSHDNDFLKIINGTDRYYTFGLIAGYQKDLRRNRVNLLPAHHFKDPDNKYIGGVVAAIKGYTPNREEDRNNSFPKRPFAGTFTMRPYLILVNQNRLFRLDLEIGIRGPASHAGRFQNWVHEKIGDDRIEGWDNQLGNKVLINFYGQFTKPFLILKGFEVIPESSLALGNHFTYLQQAVKVRIGLFNGISNTISYFTHMGDNEVDKYIEIFASLTLFGRLSLVDATLSNLSLIDDLTIINQDHILGGYKVKLNFLFNRVGIIVAYHKTKPWTNLSDKHSYGNISLNYRW